MNAKQIKTLNQGDKLFHKYYGPVEVGKVLYSRGGDLFGVIVLPMTSAGMERLMAHAQLSQPAPLLEERYRLLAPLVTDAQDKLLVEWGSERVEAAKVALFAFMEANPDQKMRGYLEVLTGDMHELLSAMTFDLGQQLAPTLKKKLRGNKSK